MQDLKSDKDLAQRAVTGDETAWKQIYDNTSDRLFSFLCYQVGDRDEALDLLQETYLKAFRSLGAYRGDAPLGSWLRVIALRKALDWKRSILQRLKKTVEIQETTASLEPEVSGIRFDSEQAGLHRALQDLSANQRAALLLREWDEWSFREISQVLGCKESTVRVHHARARERMKRALLEDSTCVGAEGLEGQKS